MAGWFQRFESGQIYSVHVLYGQHGIAVLLYLELERRKQAKLRENRAHLRRVIQLVFILLQQLFDFDPLRRWHSLSIEKPASVRVNASALNADYTLIPQGLIVSDSRNAEWVAPHIGWYIGQWIPLAAVIDKEILPVEKAKNCDGHETDRA